MPESRKLYDLVVYGATGYTGQFVTEEVAKVASLEQKKGQSLTWAVAGRKQRKAFKCFDLENIPIIEADNTRKETLSEMASKATVVINCVGPYQLYGEDVVKACIENGANHVDISGEPQGREREAGVCGWVLVMLVKSIIHKNSDVNLWCFPFPNDEPSVNRSQRYLHDVKGLHPIQYDGFAGFTSFCQTFGVIIGALYFLSFCLFGWTRNLLLKYPEIITFGTFSRAGPSRESLVKVSFTTTLIGEGWKEKLSESSDSYTTPPDSKVKVSITGPDPAYSATSLMLVASAMTLLREKSSCEKRGGVLSPGVTFMNTDIVDRLVERGMKISYEEIK
ncbi:hypothetical protein Avbf_00562 [Armadillidium vulgare]|nr:hypothetical protein Avbf_00562 [Armadillidium vulgare]